MWLIITLIVLGVLLLVAEIILLPGLTISGIAGVVSFGAAIYLGFTDFGTTGGILTIVAIVLTSILAIVLSLRAKTWQRLSLKENIESTSYEKITDKVAIGTRGKSITRLAPMGNVQIDGERYEAKSLGDVYIDQKSNVEVVGYENFNLIVKKVEAEA